MTDTVSEAAVEAAAVALVRTRSGRIGRDEYADARAALEAALPLLVAEERAIRPGDVFGDDLVAIPIADYNRLIMAAEDDDMLIWCEVCGAWIDREDEACAKIEDFSGCWKVASARERDGHLCRSYRAVRDIRADKGGDPDA